MILWFSGTGNSRSVAERLSLELGQRMVELCPGVTSTPLSVPDDDVSVIWVFPIYSWGVPPYIRKIIREISFQMGGRTVPLIHHLVVTCGDDCGLAPEMWRKEIASRGWTAGNTYSVIMPNNYVSLPGFDVDSKELESEKLAAAPARIKTIADELHSFANGDPVKDNVVRGSFAWFKTKVIYPWFVRHAMSPRSFRHTNACISCGKCAAVCPLRNIAMQPATSPDSSGRTRKYPSWGPDCAGCLACYHICPRHAVMYGKSTEKKGQYFNPFVRTL